LERAQARKEKVIQDKIERASFLGKIRVLEAQAPHKPTLEEKILAAQARKDKILKERIEKAEFLSKIREIVSQGKQTTEEKQAKAKLRREKIIQAKIDKAIHLAQIKIFSQDSMKALKPSEITSQLTKMEQQLEAIKTQKSDLLCEIERLK